jgi:nucleotide-binding universal stress UspA family protein
MVIVAGIDGSDHSLLVIERALEEARLRGAALHVVHVFHAPYMYADIPLDLTEMARLERAGIWAQVNAQLDESGVDVTRVDLDGYPPDALVAYCQDVDASLLVVGTRGRGDFASIILGSTSHRAIQVSKCDVLVVKPVTV